MKHVNNHFRQVELWTEQKLKGLGQDEVIDAFNKAFKRVWDKAELTLGSVTMLAVADRIILVGREAYPWLASIQQNKEGIDVTDLSRQANPIGDDELRLGLAFLLGEFLRVLGSLTAEIISSKLHLCLMEGSNGSTTDTENASKIIDSRSPVAKGGKK